MESRAVRASLRAVPARPGRRVPAGGVRPAHVLASLDIAGLLHVDNDTVMTMSFQPLELAVNRFHPDLYSYRIQLRGRVGPSAQDRGVR